MKASDYEAVNVKIGDVSDEKALRIEKTGKIWQFDENTYAKLKNIEFHNGEIEVKVKARLLENAPDLARGFIGIAFRINEDDTGFESFYIRPSNGKNCTDPIRKIHAAQYFSYPGYTFEYFRDHGIDGYEAAVPWIDLDQWITIRAVIKDNKADFFVDGQKVLSVNDLKRMDSKGAVGLFVDIGTEGFFKDLKVITD